MAERNSLMATSRSSFWSRAPPDDAHAAFADLLE
jgi:hypothetical protein